MSNQASRLTILRRGNKTSRTGLGRPALFMAGLLALGIAPWGFLRLWPHDPRQPTSDQEHGIASSAPRPAALPSSTARRMALASAPLPLSFEPNEGQAGEGVEFLARGPGHTLLLTGEGMVLALRSGPASSGSVVSDQFSTRGLSWFWLRTTANEPATFGPRYSLLPARCPLFSNSESPFPIPESRPMPAPPSVVRMKLVGANGQAKAVGIARLPGTTNYFIGNDPQKWRTNIPNYAQVRYGDVYPGVDLVYHGDGGQLEYDFVVRPGADPRAIALAIGAVGEPPRAHRDAPLRITADGDLVIPTEGGELLFRKPVVYQEGLSPVSHQLSPTASNRQSTFVNRQLVSGRFVLLADNRVGFEVPAYDRTRPLVIDPTLAYSTYFWTAGAIAVDVSGSAYVFGTTSSTSEPTLNAFQSSYGGGQYDAYVIKLNPSGSALVYATYLGGSGLDSEEGIAVDSSGNAYLAGYTTSTNFPTVNPLQAQCKLDSTGSCSDAFVAKLDPRGSGLFYSTYLGGSGVDQPQGIAVNSSGSAFVIGETTSTDFPTVNPLQASNGGGTDAFITGLRPDGTGLIFSTYLGGTDRDTGSGIAIDASGFIYATGGTISTNFPTPPGAFQASSQGSNDAFVAKIDCVVPKLLYSTRLGGSDAETGFGIAPDSSGNAYVKGLTGSTNFPVTSGAFQTAYRGGSPLVGGDYFISKLNPTLSQLIYSTFLGGSGAELQAEGAGGGISIDSARNAFVVGSTMSHDFPLANAMQSSFPEGAFTDGVVTELSPDGSRAIFSTYLGGNGDSGVYGVAVDIFGNAYVSGGTTSTGLPLVNPLQPLPPVGGFISKISSSPPAGPDFALSATPGTATVSAGQSATYTLTVTPASGFNSTVSLGRSGLPQGAACAFSPASVTPDGTNPSTATATVTTTARSTAPPRLDHRPLSPLLGKEGAREWLTGQLLSLLALMLFVAFWASWPRPAPLRLLGSPHSLGGGRGVVIRRRAAWALPTLIALGVLLWFGCGGSPGSGSGGGGGGGGSTGTPAGNYQITFTGASGSITRSAAVNLVVD